MTQLKRMAKSGATLKEISAKITKHNDGDIILMARYMSVLNTRETSERNERLRNDQRLSFSAIYAERGRKWVADDEQRLMKLYLGRYSEDQIAERLQRSITAIRYRIVYLLKTPAQKEEFFNKIRPFIGVTPFTRSFIPKAQPTTAPITQIEVAGQISAAAIAQLEALAKHLQGCDLKIDISLTAKHSIGLSPESTPVKKAQAIADSLGLTFTTKE
ncbi:MAG: hypothetical protein Q4B68_04465 [Bacteroidales bacterium]|nr:hypothetical protein [Bacteroidales bacterium]